MVRLRTLVVAAVVGACGLAGCGSGTSERSAHTTAHASLVVPDTSPRGRLAFGCALERGLGTSGPTLRHYARRAARYLFIATLEARPATRLAARLWDAMDDVEGDRIGARQELLQRCAEAGLEDRARLAELRRYACLVNTELIEDRPRPDSFGPERTNAAPGDPRRSDVSFLDAAYLLLALEDGPRWLDGTSPGAALGTGDPAGYTAALRNFAETCAAD